MTYSYSDAMQVIKELREGKKPNCPECGQGKLMPIGGDPKKAHCFVCDNNNCDFTINID